MPEPVILLVDDIPEYLDTMEINLPDGCKVLRATSAHDAESLLAAEHVDLAVIDVRLSENDPSNRDGLELLRRIRSRHRETASIMISAYREFELEAESLALGALFFMKKPLQPDAFRDAVREALHGS